MPVLSDSDKNNRPGVVCNLATLLSKFRKVPYKIIFGMIERKRMSLMPSGAAQTRGFVYRVPQDSHIGLCYATDHPENRALECMADEQTSFF